MHILEERKKSLAYDLKLSCRQIGIRLEMKENQDACQLYQSPAHKNPKQISTWRV